MNRGMQLLSLVFFIFANANVQAQNQTVFLIRHAEKTLDGGTDPGLSAKGHERAERFAELIKPANPTAIYSTQYQRTLRTGQPLASALGIPVTVIAIDKDNASSYASLLLERICALPKGANAVVIGHSNSIPSTIEAWTHEKVKPIEENDYDRLFLVKLNECQASDSMDIRY